VSYELRAVVFYVQCSGYHVCCSSVVCVVHQGSQEVTNETEFVVPFRPIHVVWLEDEDGCAT
jgi:hypothetical protein